jgi:NADH:ubiquinone oxidoreductase subunit 6 (subunit J)
LPSELALLASVALVATAAGGLFAKRMSVSLIFLFYSSVTLGIIYTLYGSVLVGLLHIITFAGAISVMLLTSMLMIGESSLDIGVKKLEGLLIGLVSILGVAASYVFFAQLPTSGTQEELQPLSLLQFVWQFRPWDLLILIMIFASSMIAVANLLSRES